MWHYYGIVSEMLSFLWQMMSRFLRGKKKHGDGGDSSSNSAKPFLRKGKTETHTLSLCPDEVGVARHWIIVFFRLPKKKTCLPVQFFLILYKRKKHHRIWVIGTYSDLGRRKGFTVHFATIPVTELSCHFYCH